MPFIFRNDFGHLHWEYIYTVDSAPFLIVVAVDGLFAKIPSTPASSHASSNASFAADSRGLSPEALIPLRRIYGFFLFEVIQSSYYCPLSRRGDDEIGGRTAVAVTDRYAQRPVCPCFSRGDESHLHPDSSPTFHAEGERLVGDFYQESIMIGLSTIEEITNFMVASKCMRISISSVRSRPCNRRFRCYLLRR